MQDINEKKVNYTVFSFVIGVFIIAMGWIFVQHDTISAKVDNNTASQAKIETQLAQIQTDLQWIKLKLIDLEK